MSARLAILLVSGSMAFACASGAANAPLKVPVAQVEWGVDKLVKIYPGRVVPVAQVNVIPQVDGEILEVGFENGAVVKKGLSILGSAAADAGPQAERWLKANGVI